MNEWGYPHLTRGTCIAGCERYGYCHCGCGLETTIARHNDSFHHITAGQPRIFTNRHHNPMNRGGWSRNGVEIHTRKIDDMLQLLKTKMGTWKEVSILSELPSSTIYHLAENRATRTSPQTAQHIVVAVMRMKERKPGVDPLDRLNESARQRLSLHERRGDFSTPTSARVATPQEAEAQRKYNQAQERAYYRNKRKEAS